MTARLALPIVALRMLALRMLACLFAAVLAIDAGAIGATRADTLPALHRVVGVSSDDVLNIRAQPHAGAPIIGMLAPGADGVEVVALSEDGRWDQVNSGEQAGWSHMRYLQRQTADSWRDGTQGLRCFGTEPFWRLSLFLPGHRAEFDSLNEGGFDLVTDAGTLPATRFPPTLAIPFSGSRDGMAVLRGEACNDGMSDQAFGISALIYWRGDTEGLSGCCSLR